MRDTSCARKKQDATLRNPLRKLAIQPTPSNASIGAPLRFVRNNYNRCVSVSSSAIQDFYSARSGGPE
jgi:hypothetical protein